MFFLFLNELIATINDMYSINVIWSISIQKKGVLPHQQNALITTKNDYLYIVLI